MAKTDFYRIRFPDPDQRYNGTRYLFSLSLNKREMDMICPSLMEQWVIKNTPAWLLALVGQETISPLVNLDHIRKLVDIKSEAYVRSVDILFSNCPVTDLSSGRSYRRKSVKSATLTNDTDISHQIVAYWEQGVKLLSSLSYNYFYHDILTGNKAISLHLKRLMVQIMDFTDGKSVEKGLTIKKVKLMLTEQQPEYVIAFENSTWQAARADLKALDTKGRGTKTHTFRNFSNALLDSVSNFEHSDDEDDPISNAKQENKNPSPKERQGKTPAPPNSTQETVTMQQPTSSTQKQDDKQLTASQSQDEPPASTPNDITETAPSEQKPPEARKKPDLRALARMVPER